MPRVRRQEHSNYLEQMIANLLDGIELDENMGCSIGLLSRDSQPEFAFHGRCVVNGNSISTDTLWEAASLSKPVVALLALARSAQASDFLTSPLVTSREQFGADDDSRWAELTLWHALNHTTGLPNWRPSGDPLSFESDPGTSGYSGEGFELLLVELAARAALPADVLLDRHLRSLKMSRSSFTPDLEQMAVVAIGHGPSDEAIQKVQVETARASGSLHTTAADYMSFVSAVARPDAIANPSLQGAARRMGDRSVEHLPGYGRTPGWAFTQTADGDVLWQHGDNPGFKHIAAVRPATAEAVVVFTNSDNGQALYREVCKRVLAVDVW